MSSTKLRYGTPEEAGMLPDRIEHVKKLAEGWVKEGKTPSLVVLAARRGVICLHEAYGVLTPEDDSPLLQLDSIFPLSSLTKPITATAIMILVEDGLLGLNRPLVDYIPEISGEGTGEVLVHHLLTHTSGYNDIALFELARKRDRDAAIPPCEDTQHPLVHELLTIYYPAPLWKPPGEVMSYCTHGYKILGEIVRRVSGQSLAEFARERIFDPLGMVDTNYIVPESLDPRIVKRPPGAAVLGGVSRFDEGLDSRQMRETPYGDSGVWSTVMDTAIFGQMFLNNGRYGDARVLSLPAVSEMTRNQVPGIGAYFFGVLRPEASWGFSWAVHGNGKWKYYDGSLHSQQSFSHSGVGGVILWMDPVSEIVVAYFSVILEITLPIEPIWNFDLFQNAVTAAVSD